jgi:hypothetical protein
MLHAFVDLAQDKRDILTRVASLFSCSNPLEKTSEDV